VFVIHFSKVRRDIVARTVQKLRESRVPVLGAVLNNMDLEKHGYYYYPYRYSYYYRKESEDSNPSEQPAPTTRKTTLSV
jgi:Mrp family chromosome partitioning ATPase